jgi:hypothetical protein
MTIVKSLSSTRVVSRVSAIPPECRTRPASEAASTLPPVIGNARPASPALAGASGAAAIPRLCSAAAAPGSSASVVSRPVKTTSL